MNSFDTARNETKPFVGVQEITTLWRYSGNWACLLLFLVRIAGNDEYSTIRAFILPDQSSLRLKVDTVVAAATALTLVISGFAVQNHSGTYSDWPEFAGAKERKRETTQPCNAIPLNWKQQ